MADAHPITFRAVALQGFRAYLKHQKVELRRGKRPLNLAIYAPNAKGKSSLVDAFEFFFSKTGTLERLGTRAVQTRAGRGALAHVYALQEEIAPRVHLWFQSGAETFDEAREVVTTDKGSPRPKAATRVLHAAKVPFIIRGYELRRFVDERTPEQRYEEISGWLALGSLVEVQKNIRQLRNRLKQCLQSTHKESERLRDLGKLTGQALNEWHDVAVIAWLSQNVLAPLDKNLSFASLASSDLAYDILKARKTQEDEQIGLTALNRFKVQIDKILCPPSQKDANASGSLVAFEAAITAYADASATERTERNKVTSTVLNELLRTAKTIFDDDAVALDSCPVCDTPFPDTHHGTRSDIRVSLQTKLDDLKTYHDASKALNEASSDLDKCHAKLKQDLETLSATIDDHQLSQSTGSINTYRAAVDAWQTGSPTPSSTAAEKSFTALRENLEVEIKRVEEKQGEHTYAHALETVDALIALKRDLERLKREKAELTALNDELTRQTGEINRAIVTHTDGLIGCLRDTVNDFYRKIQVEDAPLIRLELPPQDDANQQRLHLWIDFAENREAVVPGGYLSDSQIHTLALSLRLAAIKLFNKQFPVVILDDIVTSYDADHRKTIAGALASKLEDFQVLLVTHDERFFRLLQDHLPEGKWRYSRITGIVDEFGPKFHDHRVPDEEIQRLLDAGENAANEMRQAEDDWLTDICRAFGVDVRIRSVHKPYEYSRAELAKALARFLKECDLTPPEVPGIANPFLSSLQRGEVENFGSHFSDNPSASGSIGDEKTRWQEFLYFRALFRCPECGSRKFTRPDTVSTPLCQKCNTPFTFSVDAA